MLIHSTERNQYYRWSYREDWEVNATVPLVGFHSYCWNSSNSSNLLLGSAEKTVYGQLADMLTEIIPTDRRLSALYRIIVKQNVISKRAHDYYANIKKNSQLSGSIFSPVPSELRGNIACITDPKRPVIGYIDVSATTKRQRFISRDDNLYERPWEDCAVRSEAELIELYGSTSGYVLYSGSSYVKLECVDCTLRGGTQKPDDWPNNH